MLLPDIMDTILFLRIQAAPPKYHERMEGALSYAREHGWRVQVAERLDGDKVASLLDLWRPLGVIVESAAAAERYPASLFPGLPVVYLCPDWGTMPYAAGRIGYVEHDSTASARIAAKELLSLECAAYAYVPNFAPSSWSEDRARAFRQILGLHGKRPSCFSFRQGVEDRVAWHNALRDFLKGLPRPCGVFAANDPVGETVLVACADIGLSVPEDVAVIGVDDYEAVCENTVPTLSSVALDFTGAGRASAELLDELLRTPSARPAVRTFGVRGLTRRASTLRLPNGDAEISKALEMIRLRACDGLRARDVLNAMGCSRRLAEMRFRFATGQSPLEAIQARRLECACEMLSGTDRTVEAIANMCGYGNPAFLEKLFRRHFGMPPSEWRQTGHPAQDLCLALQRQSPL